MKWIDLPPVWLAGCLALVWGLRSPTRPPYLMFEGQVTFGTLLVLSGLVLMVLAVWEMRRHRTTVIPHLNPDALVTTGIFRWTRNPIYLGDVLVLVGLILRWNAHWSAFLLIPIFVWIISTRFIRAEEERLRTHFGATFVDYAEVTRRWF